MGNVTKSHFDASWDEFLVFATYANAPRSTSNSMLIAWTVIFLAKWFLASAKNLLAQALFGRMCTLLNNFNGILDDRRYFFSIHIAAFERGAIGEWRLVKNLFKKITIDLNLINDLKLDQVGVHFWFKKLL